MEYLLENGGDLTQFGGPRLPGYRDSKHPEQNHYDRIAIEEANKVDRKTNAFTSRNENYEYLFPQGNEGWTVKDKHGNYGRLLYTKDGGEKFHPFNINPHTGKTEDTWNLDYYLPMDDDAVDDALKRQEGRRAPTPLTPSGQKVDDASTGPNIIHPGSKPPGDLKLGTAQNLIEDYYKTHPDTAQALQINAGLADAHVGISPDDLGNTENISNHLLRKAFSPNNIGTPVSKKIFNFVTDLKEGSENIKLGWNDFMNDVSNIKGDELANLRFQGTETDEDGNRVFPEDSTTFDDLLAMRKYSSDKLTTIAGDSLDSWNQMLGNSINKLAKVKDMIFYPTTQEETIETDKVKRMISEETDSTGMEGPQPTSPVNPVAPSPVTPPDTTGVRPDTTVVKDLINDPEYLSMSEDDVIKKMNLR